MPDYSMVDKPSLLQSLFYPRPDFSDCPLNGFDFFVPVDPGVLVACRFYVEDRTYPWILHFHGNGEVVSDYDDISRFYNQIGLNLVVADYRGYGGSGGTPTFSNLIKDAHSVFAAVNKELARRDYRPELWIMGRSMGSISALELACQYPDKIGGMIIESGFVSVVRLIRHLGLPSEGADLSRLEQECIDIVSRIRVPSLIIHGQLDNLVPLHEGKDLFEHLGTSDKKMVVIPYADHNNIMFIGLRQYFAAIRQFTQSG